MLHQLLDLIRNPGELIALGGYPALALIIFLETGALVFFLPGDSLLVMAGLYAAQGSLNILWLNLLLIPLAILGDAVSYFIGYRAGKALMERPRSRFFRPELVAKAHMFYEKHGGKAIILARFVPVLRTFVPVVAGVGQMGYRKFAFYNIIGGTSWIFSMTLIGYVLGTRFPILIAHIDKVIVAVVLLSILPPLIEWIRSRGRAPEAA
ncbi:MAG: VTT domain-containing protein [Clostridia bacterium]|nr:VTT domain-containing protein [Deltaproteobacteria bacterium]